MVIGNQNQIKSCFDIHSNVLFLHFDFSESKTEGFCLELKILFYLFYFPPYGYVLVYSVVLKSSENNSKYSVLYI